MGNLCCCLPTNEELETDHRRHRNHQTIIVRPPTTISTSRVSVRGTNEVPPHSQRRNGDFIRSTIDQTTRHPININPRTTVQPRTVEPRTVQPRTNVPPQAVQSRTVHPPTVQSQTVRPRIVPPRIVPSRIVPPRTVPSRIVPPRTVQPRIVNQLCAKILSKNQEFGQYSKTTQFLDFCGPEYAKMVHIFQRRYKIVKIQKILNPHLQASYMLRKYEYCLLYGKDNLKEKLMFHGTKSSNVTSISSSNLDWRRNGSNKGHMYGQGVNFSPQSYYASHYSDDEDVNIMFVFTVMVCHFCKGSRNMVMPPVCDSALYCNARFDTGTQNGRSNSNVIVKFRDDEFYPSYLIKYKGRPIKRDEMAL